MLTDADVAENLVHQTNVALWLTQAQDARERQTQAEDARERQTQTEDAGDSESSYYSSEHASDIERGMNEAGCGDRQS